MENAPKPPEPALRAEIKRRAPQYRGMMETRMASLSAPARPPQPCGPASALWAALKRFILPRRCDPARALGAFRAARFDSPTACL